MLYVNYKSLHVRTELRRRSAKTSPKCSKFLPRTKRKNEIEQKTVATATFPALRVTPVRPSVRPSVTYGLRYLEEENE